MRRMKITLAGVVVMLLGACTASGPNVYTDADPGADFARYNSYAFLETAGHDAGGDYETLSGRRMEDAIAARMEGLGYQLDIRNPDLLVNFGFSTVDRQYRSPARVYGGYGYRHYRHGVYTGWPVYDPGYVRNVTEGTVSVDLVDRRSNQTVWEGKAVARINDEWRNNPDQAMSRVVAAIFARYPYQAGSNIAVTTSPASQ